MKRLYLVSDTHGNRCFDPFLSLTGDADMYAHLGDYVSDGEALRQLAPKPVITVKGNGDFGNDAPVQEIISLGGARILLLHGHTVGVKYSLDRLAYLAAENDVQCACYGHTHISGIDWVGGVLLVCPGAFGRYEGSYARLSVENGVIVPDLFTL